MAKKTGSSRLAGIEGGEELKRQIERLGRASREAMVEACEAGGKVIRDEARRILGSDDVEMRVSHQTEKLTEVEIGPPAKKWRLQFLETGAAGHKIKARKEPAMMFYSTPAKTNLVVTGGVQHPGMQARPFLRPAVDTQENQAKDRLGEVLREAIEAVARGG